MRTKATHSGSILVTSLIAGITFLGGCGSSSPQVAPLAPGGAKSVYVIQGQQGAQTILQFPATTSGSVIPISTLNALTGMWIRSIAFDATGELYVGGLYAPNIQSFDYIVNVYAPGANGSATPLRTIQLDRGSDVDALAVDSAGQLYIVSSNSTINVYSPTANGAATPIRTMSSLLGTIPLFMTVDSAGTVYVTDGGDIAIISPGSNSPSRVITQSGAYGVAVDSVGDIYAMEYDYIANSTAIVEFGPGATGAATPIKRITCSALANGDGVGLQLDSAGNLYIAATTQRPFVPFVLGFGPTASGNVQPAVNFTSTSWAVDNPTTPTITSAELALQ